MTVPIKNVLEQVLKEYTDWRLVLIQQWPIIMGGLHTKMRIEKICDSTIFLGVYDSSWMAELHLLSRLIIKKINGALATPQITQVRFRLAHQAKRPALRAKVEKQAPRVIAPVVLTPEQSKALSAVKDPQLQELLKRFLARCQAE
jgi:hypothetical protein